MALSLLAQSHMLDGRRPAGPTPLVWHSRLLKELQDAEFVQGATGQRYQVGFARLGAGKKDA